MSLDTVELANPFGRYFSLEILEAVIEKIYTAGNVAAWFGQQLGVVGRRGPVARTTVP